MRDLKQEAECFSVDQRKLRSGVKLELNTVVSEINSPPRITRAARMLLRLGITPGFALDLTTNDENGQPWDFDDSRQRNRATRKVLVEQPDLLVGSPMCVEFSARQRLNKAKIPTPEEYDERRRKAVRHLEFVCKLYRLQSDAGRLLFREHPAQASSWEEDCVERIMKLKGTKCITMDQCTLWQSDKDGKPVKKPTKWMSN